MADTEKYPQVPASVWWGLRSLYTRNPSTRLDPKNFASLMSVQLSAARQYLKELKSLGLIDEEGKATALALEWRTDEGYSEARDKLLASAYPQSLRDVAKASPENRSTIERWFVNHGLGQGTAKNKTATYILIGSNPPTATENGGDGNTKAAIAVRKSSAKPAKISGSNTSSQPNNPPKPSSNPSIDARLNVNVQIHISADASLEQINAIFEAMRRNLYDS